ncbi:hypothetical protein BD626DRAFT_174441 [Schizophyllum amplum]|uniref:Uncharacterized protein n=1 Tax=Schizophyllum amplum TaxID=97359 RepID=A0A550C2J5_9AGAR|nr:hypothetical protein BD626DRAFT_174441 [Auriculariopsis ampla]
MSGAFPASGTNPSAVGHGVDPMQDREQRATETAPPNNESYPEQKHAGTVGYGPAFHIGPTTGDKMAGLKETAKGKLTGNHDLVRQGKERRTGELQKREQESEDQDNPFGAGPPQEQNHVDRAATVAPEGTDRAEHQRQGGNTDRVKHIG